MATAKGLALFVVLDLETLLNVHKVDSPVHYDHCVPPDIGGSRLAVSKQAAGQKLSFLHCLPQLDHSLESWDADVQSLEPDRGSDLDCFQECYLVVAVQAAWVLPLTIWSAQWHLEIQMYFSCIRLPPKLEDAL